MYLIDNDRAVCYNKHTARAFARRGKTFTEMNLLNKATINKIKKKAEELYTEQRHEDIIELLTPLDSLMSQRKLREDEVLRIGIDICSALELCEAKNILHRDIKPANIFYNDKTPGYIFYKLGDFGIARSLQAMTHGLSTKGTPNYMAPEVFAGKPYDHRADLYSLGITLYRLLNENRHPFSSGQDFSAAAREQALARRMTGEPLPLPTGGSREADPGL